jgi:hypothetical protein
MQTLRCEKKLPAPIFKRPGCLDIQPGHCGALRPGEGVSYVAGGYAGAQGVRRVGEGSIDFLVVVGSSGHGGGRRRNVASRECSAWFLLRSRNIYSRGQRVGLSPNSARGRY